MSKYSDNNYDNTTDYTYDSKQQSQKDATNKVAKTAAKGAATYFAGPLGGAAVDALSKTKLGQNAINKGGDTLRHMPGMAGAAEKLNNSGMLDAADKAIDAAGKNGSLGSNQAPVTQDLSQVNDNKLVNQPNEPEIAGVPKRNKNSFDSNNNTEKDFEATATGVASMPTVVKVGLIVGIAAVLLIVLFAGFIPTLIFNMYEDAFGISEVTGATTGDVEYTYADQDAQDFYERVNLVKLELQQEGKTVDALKVVAVFHIISTNNNNVDYNDMSKKKIRDIANSMFDGNYYNEEVFRQNLTNDIFKTYFKLSSKEYREELTDKVFQYIDDYYAFIGNDQNTCSAGGSCTYNIKGFSVGGRNIIRNIQVTNLKVRLMQCGGDYGSGTWGLPLEGEALVDFEKYVLGVSYGEVGSSYPEAAVKAQLVAARSYSLSRPAAMNNANGKKLEQENNQWILQMCSCVADQVYCDPDQGCSRMNDGTQGGTIRSGHSVGTYRSAPLAVDSLIRTWAKDVEGEVLVNAQGNIINTTYIDVTQREFKSLAEQGLDYKQILLQVYNQGSKNFGATDIQKMSCGGNSANCNSGTVSSGEYSTWKQTDAKWSSVPLGSDTVGEIGCLATSVAMLIAKSGVQTVVPGEFNPGTFVEYLNARGGFVYGNFQWAAASIAAPNFQYAGGMTVAGFSDQQKINAITDLLNQGYYVVAKVSSVPQHWVAIDSVTNNQVNIMDPSASATILGQRYPMSATDKLQYFKVV